MSELWAIDGEWAEKVEAALVSGGFYGGGGRPTPNLRGGRAVAVVPILGVLDRRIPLFLGTDPANVADQVTRATLDPNVGSILLLVDSPGGSIPGIPEAAAAIREARAVKPVVTVADGMMGSAALWLGAQADHVLATRGSSVGSVGVFVLHTSVQGFEQRKGIKRTFVESSPDGRKVEGNPFADLSPEAQAHAQGQVDRAAAMFYADLAAGRRIPVSAVKAKFSGRSVLADDAASRGWIDAIGSPQGTLGALAAGTFWMASAFDRDPSVLKAQLALLDSGGLLPPAPAPAVEDFDALWEKCEAKRLLDELEIEKIRERAGL
jgi:signal peptide peptidase SppA